MRTDKGREIIKTKMTLIYVLVKDKRNDRVGRQCITDVFIHSFSVDSGHSLATTNRKPQKVCAC